MNKKMNVYEKDSWKWNKLCGTLKKYIFGD